MGMASRDRNSMFNIVNAYARAAQHEGLIAES